MKTEKATAKREANTAHFQSGIEPNANNHTTTEPNEIIPTPEQLNKPKRFSVKTVNGKFCLENSQGELVDKFGQPVETVGDVFFYHNQYKASMAANWLNDQP
jgi:hypothetical protein